MSFSEKIAYIHSFEEKFGFGNTKAKKTFKKEIIEVFVPNKKISLCIGNQGYHKDEEKLSSCWNDASEIHEILKTFNFQATLIKDATKEEIENSIECCLEKIENGDMFFFYFSGHGAQPNGNSIILGIDGNSVKIQTKLINKIVNSKKSIALIIVLDSCRTDINNTTYKIKKTKKRTTMISQETEEIDQSFRNVRKVLVYSSDPGRDSETAGENSFFTGVFKKHLKENGESESLQDIITLTHSDIIKNYDILQMPWVEISSPEKIILGINKEKNEFDEIDEFLKKSSAKRVSNDKPKKEPTELSKLIQELNQTIEEICQK
eukprot:gene5211-8823_t